MIIVLIFVVMHGLNCIAQGKEYAERVENIEKIKNEIKKECNAEVLSKNKKEKILEAISLPESYLYDIDYVRFKVKKVTDNLNELVLDVKPWIYYKKHDVYTMKIVTYDFDGNFYELGVTYKEKYIHKVIVFTVSRIDFSDLAD